MTLKLAHVLLCAALTVPSAGLLGCASNPAVPTAGTTIDAKFWQDFYPTFKKGMKWTYVETSTSGSSTTTGENTQEVADVQGDVATLKTTGTSALVPNVPVNQTSTTSVSLKVPVGGETGLKSEGAEDVKVPFKEYKGAAKLSLSAANGAMTTTYWVVAGVGIVKVELKTTASGTSSTYTKELKDFVSP